MAIRTRGNGLEVDVQVTRSGVTERYRETVRCTLAEAKAFEAQVRLDLTSGRKPVPLASTSKPSHSEMGLEDALEAVWEAHWKDAAVSRTVRSNMATAIQFFGRHTTLESITTPQITAYAAHLKAKGYTPSTVRSKMAVMTKAYTHFIHQEVLTSRPNFKLPKLNKNLRDRLITDAEFEELLRTFTVDYGILLDRRSDGPSGEDFADLMVILMDTGGRRSEIELIEMRNVRGDLLTLRSVKDIRDAQRDGTKTGDTRTIPLTRRALAAIHRLAGRYGTKPCHWATAGSVRHAWDWARSRMGLMDDPGFIPYALRHTCASTLYAKTKDLVVVQKWLGHTDIKMTVRYAKLQPFELQAARDLMEAST
jgi:site-specific recombinase XerD